MWLHWLKLCQLATIVCLANSSAGNLSTQLRLVNQILENYDKTLRPVYNVDTITRVRLNPALHTIIGTNEASESILFAQWFRMIWLDEFIHWNPSDFEGIQQLLLPISRIWYPDVMADNVIDIQSVVPDERNYAIIDYNGNITISIDQVITMHCEYDVTNFPFDVQNCTLRFTSWMHTAKQIELSTTYPSDLLSYKDNSAWDLISFDSRQSNTVYGVSPTAFSDVCYDIVIQRKPTFYLTTFVLPSVIITTLAIVGVFSPFNDSGDREEKVTMGLTTLLTMAVILLIITDQMPKSSGRMPLLGLFMVIQIGLSACATLTAVLVMYEHSKWTTGAKVPGWMLALARLPRNSSDQLQMAREMSAASMRSAKAVERGSDKSRILQLLEDFVTMMHRKAAEERHRHLWNRAISRVDLVLMIIFNLLNIVSTVILLAVGYSYLVV